MARRLTIISALAALLPLCAATPAAAQSAYCGMIWALQLSADPVSFGTYIPSSGSPATANGTVSVSCASEIPTVYLPSFTVGLSAGSGGSNFNPRRMSNGTYRLDYNLYTNAPYTIVWGDGTGGTQVQSYSTGANQRSVSLTMYGRVPASQTAAASGAFSDTINVTITY